MPLSDNIEQFIKELMEDSQSELELRRNELAQYFNCAPSQINYVLATRFSPEHGYIIESRRGGGGYVRIIRIMGSGANKEFISALIAGLEANLTPKAAIAMIQALMERNIIDQNEAELMAAAVSDNALSVPISAKNMLRAGIMKSMLLALLKKC
ncbi:MAG: CtsR family transcriptional regulator [Clostridiales bacterium]|nr:CtsR family transcriptional regulator [Clostridiales bacterium]MBQ2818555.1 CtsR family transcriptional regulator [Clostridia bacterium]MBQ4638847.1 CtsR family transcriptional regulator [Clostridia bacterium]